MKLLCASVLAAALGLNWASGRTDASSSATPIDCREADCREACDVRAEPLGDGTCRLECDGPEGRSWAIVACDGPDELRVVESGGPECTPCPWTPACGERSVAAPVLETVLATSASAPVCEPVLATSASAPMCETVLAASVSTPLCEPSVSYLPAAAFEPAPSCQPACAPAACAADIR